MRATDRAERRAMRQVALARCSPLAAPFLAVWLAVSAVLLAATLLIAKRPRLAWREVADVTALLHPVVHHRGPLARSPLATPRSP